MQSFAQLQSNFQGETGRISAIRLFKSHITRDGMRRHIPFLQWEDEMGIQYSYAKIEPNVPDQTTGLTQRALSVAGGAPNVPFSVTPTRIGNGVTLVPISLGDRTIDSDLFNVEDMRTSVAIQQQVEGYIATVNEGVFYDMGLTLRKLHFAASTSTYVAKADSSGNPTLTYNSVAVVGTGAGAKDDHTNALRQDFASFGGCLLKSDVTISAEPLRTVYAGLVARPQGDTVFGYTENGQPVWPAIVDMDLNPILIRDKNSLIRADVQFAWQGAKEMSPLLAPLVHPLTINGFATEIDVNMPRFNWVSGVTTPSVVPGHYAVVYKWATVSTGSTGTKIIVNPAWWTATYGVICIPTYGAFDVLVPAPKNYEGWFVPQSYVGDFKPMNELVLDGSGNLTNQDHTLAWIRAKYSMAGRGMFPEQLVWIMSLLPGRTVPTT